LRRTCPRPHHLRDRLIARDRLVDQGRSDRFVAALETRRRLDAYISRMKTATKYLTFEIPQRRGLVRITDEVAEFCGESGVQDGLILVSAMHITVGSELTRRRLGVSERASAPASGRRAARNNRGHGNP